MSLFCSTTKGENDGSSNDYVSNDDAGVCPGGRVFGVVDASGAGSVIRCEFQKHSQENGQ